MIRLNQLDLINALKKKQFSGTASDLFRTVLKDLSPF